MPAHHRLVLAAEPVSGWRCPPANKRRTAIPCPPQANLLMKTMPSLLLHTGAPCARVAVGGGGRVAESSVLRSVLQVLSQVQYMLQYMLTAPNTGRADWYALGIWSILYSVQYIGIVRFLPSTD